MLIFEENPYMPYSTTKKKIIVNQIFWRPTPWLPNGWHIIFVKDQILYENQLIHGIFPIMYCGYMNMQTSPRSYSVMRDLKPMQRLINGYVTEMVKHVFTVGSDKILIPQTANVSRGDTFHGVKTLKYNGIQPPTILPGRSGEQFFEPLQHQITMLYHIANVPFTSSQPCLLYTSPSPRD